LGITVGSFFNIAMGLAGCHDVGRHNRTHSSDSLLRAGMSRRMVDSMASNSAKSDPPTVAGVESGVERLGAAIGRNRHPLCCLDLLRRAPAPS